MDVVIFTIHERMPQHWAIEMASVEEVIPLGPVTPISSAPNGLVGAVNVHGEVCPVLRLDQLVRWTQPSAPPERSPRPLRPGHPCLLTRAGGSRFVLCVGRIDRVARVIGSGLVSSGGNDMLVSGVLDAPEGTFRLVDVEQVVRRVTRDVGELASSVMGDLA